MKGILLLIILLLASCNYERRKDINTEVNLIKIQSNFVSIQTNLLQTKCVSCHSSKPFDFTSYSGLMKSGTIKAFYPEHSPFYETIATEQMPKGSPPLSKEVVEAVETWIRNGAKETEVEPTPLTPTPVSLPPLVLIESKFSSLDKNIFQVKCLTCHNNSKASADVNFSSYKDLNDSLGLKFSPIVPKDPSKSGVVLTIETDKMPPGPEKLTAEEKNAVREWVVNGALND